MDGQSHILEELRREFQSTLVNELLPGILHNFANPLNGIMGRAKLLQKRTAETLGSAEHLDSSPCRADRDKIIRDVELITEQSDRLYELFSQVSAKIHRLHDTRRGAINLSELLSAELAFLDFYLDFKHSVEKNINLNMNIPPVIGVPYEFSLALSAILRYAMGTMKDGPLRVLSVYSDSDGASVSLSISDSGVHDADVLSAFDAFSYGIMPERQELLNGCCGLFSALIILKRYDTGFSLETGGGVNKMTLAIPCGGC